MKNKTLLSLLISGTLLMTGAANADQSLRDRANAIFKPIPEKLTEVAGEKVVAAHVARAQTMV
jgi:cytochrome c peroxidase